MNIRPSEFLPRVSNKTDEEIIEFLQLNNRYN